MTDYKHRIETDRDASIAMSPVTGDYNVQVVVGTAPVNQSRHMKDAVNRPVVVRSMQDVTEYFGWSDDYEKYTLMQAAHMSFKSFPVEPVIMINVLDPSKTEHTAAVAEKEVTFVKGSAFIEDDGILADTLVITAGGSQAEKDKDYAATVSTTGVVLAVIPGGVLENATKVTAGYQKLKPEGVKPEDIVGGLDENGVRTGIELIDEVYAKLGILPGVLTAPGFSGNPMVAMALEAKAELAGDFSNAIAVVDIDADTATKIADVAAAKEALGTKSRWVVACWPKVLVSGKVIAMSAAVSALLQYTCIRNNNIPCESPDNLSIGIDGLVLSDGTELHITQAQVNDYLNSIGVVSCIYMNGWKCWGNNTTAYPDEIAPNSRFIKNVLIANYLENRFKVDHLSKLGRTATMKRIEAIVTEFNALIGTLVPDYLAGGEVVFDKADNPIWKLQEGHLTFRTRYADYTPIEYILNKFTWDSTILEDALTGGES